MDAAAGWRAELLKVLNNMALNLLEEVCEFVIKETKQVKQVRVENHKKMQVLHNFFNNQKNLSRRTPTTDLKITLLHLLQSSALPSELCSVFFFVVVVVVVIIYFLFALFVYA